ncbi:hypothetical protein CsSME_00021820 [Camellia sinensis var. sinensis]
MGIFLRSCVKVSSHDELCIPLGLNCETAGDCSIKLMLQINYSYLEIVSSLFFPLKLAMLRSFEACYPSYANYTNDDCHTLQPVVEC